MGVIIPVSKFYDSDTSGMLKPVIYCYPYQDITTSINFLLAEKLVNCKPNRRTMLIETFFNQILKQLPDGVVIKDFDVMFNPNYKVDVLKIMVNACKRKPFSIVWPGTFEDGKLCYSENGYLDFKIFRVEDYDVTCIIQGGKP